VHPYLVNLGTVSNVVVKPYLQYRKPDFQFKVENSPETYVVVMKTDAPLPGNSESYHKNKLKSKKKLSNEARLLFSDNQTANAVSDRIRHAAKICRATRSSP